MHADAEQRVFGEAEYHSDNGMVTSAWGPAMWHVLHCMSFNYPVRPSAAQRRAYRAYLLSLRDVLPCGACRANLRANLRKLPPGAAAMASRDSFSRYVFELHELVNRMLRKPASGLSFEDVRERYEHLRARCASAPASASASESGCVEPAYSDARPQCLIEIAPRSVRARREHIRVRASCLRRRLARAKGRA